MTPTAVSKRVLGLKPGIEPRVAVLRQGRDPDPKFWTPHPEIAQGPVGWQLSRMYGPRSLEQLQRMQKFMSK